MRQSLSDCDLALRYALDHTFRRGLEIQVLGGEPFDERGKLRVSKALPPSRIDLALDRSAGRVYGIQRRLYWRCGNLRTLVVRPNSTASQPDAQHRTGEARHERQRTHQSTPGHTIA